MAISAGAIWYARAGATAAMANGGGFVTGASGTDYSNQDAAQYNLTGVTSAGAGDTVLTASAAADMVGNIANGVSGTNLNVARYEILSVVVGVSITFGTNSTGGSIAAGIIASGVINIGGALDLTGGGLDTWLEQIVGGNIVYIKSGTYTPAANPSVSSVLSTSTAPSDFIGYTTTPGDTCNDTDRPLIAMGPNTWTWGQFQFARNLRATGTATLVLSFGAGAHVKNVKCVNTSTTAGRPALRGSSDAFIEGCEGVSLVGQGIDDVSTGAKIFGCYAHDSATGISIGSSRENISDNIIHSCTTAGIDLASSSGASIAAGNTVYGTEAKEGIGIRIAASAPNEILINNIIYGCVTGISQTTSQLKSNMGRNNALFNCTTNATNYTLDSTDQTAINPTFTAAAQLTGATATISGSTLTQTGAFAANVVDGVSFIHVLSGTGATVGIYPIVSHTDDTVTVTNTIGTDATADKVWYIHYGTNFAINGAL